MSRTVSGITVMFNVIGELTPEINGHASPSFGLKYEQAAEPLAAATAYIRIISSFRRKWVAT
jgi:hypothetical protein